jgi:hypothetical protein
MKSENAVEHSITAVRESALELGFEPLESGLVERIVDYGIEALIECTLAAQKGSAIDVNVRGVMYARSIERVGAAIAAQYQDTTIAVC